MGTLRFVISLVLGIALTYGVQRWDKALLSPTQRERAWNGASWAAALYAFGPFSMLGWVCVTRIAVAPWWPRSRLRAVAAAVLVLAGGLAAARLIIYLMQGADWIVAWLAGIPADPE